MRSLIGKLFTDGIAPNPSDNLQVSAGDGMAVTVSAGFAICGSCLKLEEESRTLAVQAANANYDRIDTVVLRLNANDSARYCDLYVVQGTAADSPVRPTLTRTSTIWELGLADIFVGKNSGSVSSSHVTDTRYDTARCGVMSSISQFDTTTIYDQVQADLAEFKEEEQADFLEWYENMKDQLSEDAAGNLQQQIEVERARIDNLTKTENEGTVDNTEISDARIGYDNTEYKTLGAAIRGQCKDLNDQITELKTYITEDLLGGAS